MRGKKIKKERKSSGNSVITQSLVCFSRNTVANDAKSSTKKAKKLLDTLANNGFIYNDNADYRF